MIYSNRKFSSWLQPCFFVIMNKLASLIKVSFIFGSYTAFFSAVNIVAPLSGAFGGVAGSWIVFFLGLAIRSLLGGTCAFHMLIYHIPGLCASLYWGSSHPGIRLLVPQLCLFLFLMHPVGSIACMYALYWVIPIALYFYPQKGIFFHALGSTLTAHAVGSVIWLYAMPTDPSMWYALIPVVFIERFIFALGMVVMYKLIARIVCFASSCNMLHYRVHTSV